MSIMHSVCFGLAIWVVVAPPAFTDTSISSERLEAAAEASLGGPASVQAQQEEDRIRRLENSRWPDLDSRLNSFEQARDRFGEKSGLSLSFDYQALFQKSSSSLTGTDAGASGQARILGNWALLNRGGRNTGSLVFILENRHRLGQPIAPSGLANEIGYVGATGVTFSDTDTTLSVAYWSQTLAGGNAGLVAGRIDPGDYSDILGYVNPRTTFLNYSILFSPVLPIPDPGFGIGGGGFLSDHLYAFALVSDANGSMTDLDWFPGGSELYKYIELGWTPERSQRYLTNVHIGAYHVDEREEAGVPSAEGVMLSANKTFDSNLMVFGRLGWSDGQAPIARRAVNAGLLWRPGTYDDLFGFGVTYADPSDSALDKQTTIEAFYRFDLSDNIAITGDIQYINNPGFNEDDPLIFGLRVRFNL